MEAVGSLVEKNAGFGMVDGGGVNVGENFLVLVAADDVAHGDVGDAGNHADVVSAADAVVLVLAFAREAGCYNDDNLVLICLGFPLVASLVLFPADKLDEAACHTHNDHPRNKVLVNDDTLVEPLEVFQYEDAAVTGNHQDNKNLEVDQKN